MNRMFAIIERELRKFFRSPALMMVSLIFPLVQLVVLGNAFGGKIRDAKMGIVDQDGLRRRIEGWRPVLLARAHQSRTRASGAR